MTSIPLLTIAVPTYNGSKTIRTMFDYLLPQVTDEIEILVSDNCSTDSTQQIILDYSKKYKIRYIRNIENLGADWNFLQCMRNARGKFSMLMSDDDILMPGSIEKILSYLKNNPDVSLVYLDSVSFKDKFVSADECRPFNQFAKEVKDNLVTTNKAIFQQYCQRLWGFTSAYIWKTDNFNKINNPERFFNSFFLQSYINIECSKEQNSLVGVIKGPILAVGEYGILGNYDVAIVEGINYKKMMEYAIKIGGYDKKQFNKYYIWKICYLGRGAIVKQRAINVKKTKISNLFKCSWNHPYAWIHLFPYFFAPSFLCRWALKISRKKQGRSSETYVNRPTN